MTKRELSQNITRTFETLLEEQFKAFDIDESEGGRRGFSIEHPLAERGYFQFEWSRTNQDVCSWDSIKWVNGTDKQNAAREACVQLEKETQNLLDLVVANQTEIYNQTKVK